MDPLRRLTKPSSGRLNRAPRSDETSSSPPSIGLQARPATAAAASEARLSAPYRGRGRKTSSVNRRNSPSREPGW